MSYVIDMLVCPKYGLYITLPDLYNDFDKAMFEAKKESDKTGGVRCRVRGIHTK